jgi:hypothetical protein
MSTKNTLLPVGETQNTLQKEDTAAVDDTTLAQPEVYSDDTSKKQVEEQPEENRKFYNIISTF